MAGLIHSATVVILKHMCSGSAADEGMQVLLLKRNSKLKTHGGSWVFPGGKIENKDYSGVNGKASLTFSDMDLSAQESIARQAAIRETHEEAGLVLAPETLGLCSRWLTPETMSKRFDAWFFITESSTADITIDGSEIHDYQWIYPKEALRKQTLGEITLPPPTYVTLCHLVAFTQASKAIQQLCEHPIHYRPKLTPISDGFCSLYEEDAGYPDGNISMPGARHRLLMQSGKYEYVSSIRPTMSIINRRTGG